jgi:hypothetical protein
MLRAISDIDRVSTGRIAVRQYSWCRRRSCHGLVAVGVAHCRRVEARFRISEHSRGPGHGRAGEGVARHISAAMVLALAGAISLAAGIVDRAIVTQENGFASARRVDGGV